MNILIEFIKKYRWLTIPVIPLVLFLVLTILMITPREDKKQPALPTPPMPITDKEAIGPTIALLMEQGYDPEIEEPLEIREDFQKREPINDEFSDGTVMYSFKSTNPERPNIIITQGEQVILFQRNVTDPAYPVLISHYTSVDGKPERIIHGSRFYGPDKQLYFYGKKGVAFIADPQTKQVLEQHLFIPTTADDYLKRFGQ